MTRPWLVLPVIASTVGMARAQEAPAAKPETTARQARMAAIESEFAAAQERYAKLFEAVKTQAEYDEIAEKHQGEEPNASPWLERAWALVNEDAEDDAGYAALVWLFHNQREPEPNARVLTALADHHLKNAKLVGFCQTLIRDSRPVTREFLTKALAHSPIHEVKGIACYALARRALADAAAAERLRAGGPEADSYATYIGEEAAKTLKTLDARESRIDGEKLLENVAAQFGDVAYGKRTLGEVANGDLFEIRNLAIGCIAPDIEGEDIDGIAFKLSDYRGKVVVLDFWGHW